MSPSLTRRRFIEAAGASAAGAALLGPAGCASPAGDSSDEMNVMLVIIDTVRPDFVASYGSERVQTPHIDALGSRGIRFTRAFPEAFPTVPARRSVFGGRRIFPFTGWERTPDLGRGPGSAPIDDVSQTFTSLLKRAGYWTAMSTDNPFLGFTRSYKPFRESFDRFVSVVGHSGTREDAATVSDAEFRRWLPEGLEDDERYVEGMRRYLANTGKGEDDSESNAARVFKEASKLLEEARGQQPFALVVDSFDPHEPWSPTREYIDMYADPDYRGPNPGTARYTRAERYLEQDELRHMRAIYSAALTITDKWLGEFMGRFRELELHGSTAILFLSDHGLLLGDRGWTGKIAKELHPELIRVPFALIHPEGKAAGTTSPYFASTHDVAPTLLSMAGIDPPRQMNGVDLAPLLDGEEIPPRRFAYGGYFNHFFVRDDHWSFIADNRGGERELYDLDLDSAELDNVAAGNRDVHEELYARLLEQTGEIPYYTEDIQPGRWEGTKVPSPGDG